MADRLAAGGWEGGRSRRRKCRHEFLAACQREILRPSFAHVPTHHEWAGQPDFLSSGGSPRRRGRESSRRVMKSAARRSGTMRIGFRSRSASRAGRRSIDFSHDSLAGTAGWCGDGLSRRATWIVDRRQTSRRRRQGCHRYGEFSDTPRRCGRAFAGCPAASTKKTFHPWSGESRRDSPTKTAARCTGTGLAGALGR